MKIFRGVSDKELKEYLKKGIPKGKRFTTDILWARKYGKNVISTEFSKQKFNLDSQSETFKQLKIKEKYYLSKNPIKQFKKIMFLD